MATVSVSQGPTLLAMLASGQRAVVEAVMGASAQVQRLRELGLRDGAEVRMIQPGRPCIIGLGEQRFGFRSDDAMSVLVRPES